MRKRELVFNDQRTFGWVSVEETTDGVPSSAQHIAKDPFDPNFDRTETINKFAKRNIRIKTALLNQELMSGVGNIYADETLWRAKSGKCAVITFIFFTARQSRTRSGLF